MCHRCGPHCCLRPLQAAHPELGDSRELQVFLEAGEQDWQIEQARACPGFCTPACSQSITLQ